MEVSALEKILDVLNSCMPARNADLTEEEDLAIKPLGLLTRKAMIYAANEADSDLTEGNDTVKNLRGLAGCKSCHCVFTG